MYSSDVFGPLCSLSPFAQPYENYPTKRGRLGVESIASQIVKVYKKAISVFSILSCHYL